MMRRVTGAVVSMSLWGMPLPAVAAAAKGENEARLEVDTSELGGVGPVLKTRLLERGAQVFRDEDIGPGDSSAPVVRVSVREIEGENPGFDYEIRLITRGDEDAAAWSETCELCTEAELIDSVAVELDKVALAIRALESTAVQPEPEPQPEVPPPIVQPVIEAGAPADDRTSSRLNTKGKVGIGLLALGVGAAGAGVGLVLAPPRPLPNDPLSERYTQPPGYVALAIGGGLLVTGAVLLGLGLRDRKRSTARHTRGSFALLW